MILPGQNIRSLCMKSPAMINPFSERGTFNGLSYGLSHAGYDIRLKQNILVVEGLTTVTPSLEEFVMPYNVLGEVKDKSTLARMGLQVQNTVIEPGWRGVLAVEVSFAPVFEYEPGDFLEDKQLEGKLFPRRVSLEAGMPIAQIIFYRLEDYPEYSYSGKYQDQKADDIQAKFEF